MQYLVLKYNVWSQCHRFLFKLKKTRNNLQKNNKNIVSQSSFQFPVHFNYLTEKLKSGRETSIRRKKLAQSQKSSVSLYPNCPISNHTNAQTGSKRFDYSYMFFWYKYRLHCIRSYTTPRSCTDAFYSVNIMHFVGRQSFLKWK